MHEKYDKFIVKEMVLKGFKSFEIKKILGIQDKTLYFYLKKLNIKTPKGFYSMPIEQKKVLTKISKEKLLGYIKNGLTCFNIMEFENVCQATVSNLIRRYELKQYIKRGFYTTGKKSGREKGFKMPEEQKQKYKIMFTGKKNPFYGKKHNDKTKQKMSENHADISGDKNPFKKSLSNPENLAKLKQRRKDFWASKDECWMRNWKSKMSEIIASSEFVKNHSFNKYHDNGHILTAKAGKVFCRSSWEKKMCYVLDNCDIIKKFTLEEFTIPYIDCEGIARKTRIDFLIELNNNKKIMVEVKPESLLAINNNSFKIIGYENFCKKNNIVFKHMGSEYFPNNTQRIEEYIRSVYDDSGNEK